MYSHFSNAVTFLFDNVGIPKSAFDHNYVGIALKKTAVATGPPTK